MEWSLGRQLGSLEFKTDLIEARINTSTDLSAFDLTLIVKYPDVEAMLLFSEEKKGINLREAKDASREFNKKVLGDES